jgi:hypothetical protein
VNIITYLRATEQIGKARRRYGIRGPAVEKALDVFVEVEKAKSKIRKAKRAVKKSRRSDRG